MQPQNDGTFMLYIKAQQRIVVKMVKHIKNFTPANLYVNQPRPTGNK